MYEATDVHRGDYTDGTGDRKLIYTGDELRHVDEVGERSVETIPIDAITAIGRDTDESQSGFERIGYAFAAFGLVFSVVSLPFLLAGVFDDPVAGGSFLSAVLCWYGSVMFHRMERGAFDVLEIRTRDRRYCFLTQKGSAAFDELLSRLPADIANEAVVSDRADR